MGVFARHAAGLLERTKVRVRPAFLGAIKEWRESDCTDPAKFPSAFMAPNWRGPDRDCLTHGAPCTRCHSCSACRPEQREPDGEWWDAWLFLAGRGCGKTRSAAELVAEKLATETAIRVAIVAPTFSDARDTCVEGESGLIAVFERYGWVENVDYTWNRSLGEIKIHSTRSRAKLFSAEKPARLRGPQHHYAWVEELAQVVFDATDAWDMLKFGLRLGHHPQVIATTTPLPLALIKELMADPLCAVSRGKTDDNAANLPAVTLRDLHKKYDGTRLGRQELDGDILDDIPGALWKRHYFDLRRFDTDLTAKWHDEDAIITRVVAQAIVGELVDAGITLVRIVVGLDPAVTSGEDADESGIIVVGRAEDGEFYTLADYTIRDTPETVAVKVLQAYDDWDANAIIVEVNNGGEWITSTMDMTCRLLAHPIVNVESVHAKKGKRVRAEPVSAVYGQGLAHHVGTLATLEDLLCVWTPEKVASPDRMDALVYAYLYLDDQGTGSTLMSASPQRGTLGRHQGRLRNPATMPTTSVGSSRR